MPKTAGGFRKAGKDQEMSCLFKRVGEKEKFSFIDRRCIGRECFTPGMFQHRGATMSGSRNTGSPDSPCCMRRAYRGCPDGPEGERKNEDGSITVGLPIFDPEMARKRKAEGWKPV